MNDVIRMSRKALILAVTVTTLAWGVLATAMFAPLTASAAGCTGGTLIKGSLSAVYYCGGDGKRYVFPNKKTYDTWYSDFSGVTSISDADLATVQIGGNVTYRPGVKMVKITTDPTVYAVDANGTLRPIADEATASALYGANWNQQIDDVPDAFFTNYTVGSSATGFDASGAMSAAQSINEDKGLTGMTVTSAGVSLASDNPASATVPSNATGVSMLKFVLSNTGSASMTVDSLTLHRVGPGATGDISNVYLYEGAERLTTGRTINSTTNEVNFTGLSLELAPGASRTLWVSVDIATAPGAGNVHAFEVRKAMAGTSELGGTPVLGNNFTLSSASVGSLIVAKTGTITNPKVGEKNAKIAEFQISAGSAEDLSLQRLTLFQGGNLGGTNLTNLKLKQAGNTIATAASFNSKLRATFDIVGGFNMDKGQNKTFQVWGDIGGSARSGDTLKLYVEEDADVFAVGNTFGHGASLTRPTYDGGSCTSTAGDCSYSIIEAGQVTINFLGPSTKDISDQGNDVEAFRFTMTAQSNTEVRRITFNIAATDLLEGTTTNYSDVKITDVNTGTVWWGPLDADTDTGGTDEEDLVFNDVQTLLAGTVYEFSLTLDPETGVADGETVTMTLNGFGTSDLRNLDNSTFLTPASDVVPATALAGNPMVVKEASLAISLGATPVSQTHVKGSSNVPVLGINLKSGDAADTTITAVTLTGYIDNDGGNNAMTQGFDSADGGSSVAGDLLSCWLQDGSTNVGTAESPTTATVEGSGGLLQFTGLTYNVPAGMTNSLTLYCNISNSANSDPTGTDDTSVGFSVAVAGDITAQDPDGNALTTGAGTLSGTANAVVALALSTSVSITDTGTMTYALAPDDLESEAGLVIAGQSGVVLGKVRMTAQNEELKQTKMRVSLATPANYTNVVSMSLYDGATLVGGPVPVDSSGNADFSGMAFVVPKDASKTLTVKATLNNTSTGATSGADLAISIDLFAAATGVVEYRGTNSSTVVTSNGVLNFGTTADLAGNQKVLRKTKPTVSLASLPTTTLTNGSVVASRLTITADSAEDVALKAIKWTIARSGGVGIASPVVREVGSTNLTITSALSDGTLATCLVASSTACVVTVQFNSEQLVAAGTSKTYELVVTTDGVGTNDAITSSVAADPALVTGEIETTTSAGDSIDDGGAVATAEYNFIWSDFSSIPHNDVNGATVDGLDAAAADDWTNGLYVKVLPTDAQTVLAP